MSDSNRGYYRQPCLHADRVVFVCEDDLWSVGVSGGRAERVTAGVAEASRPCFSPDGRRLAFIGKEEGPTEVYVMPAEGGRSQRLTFQGALCSFVRFTPDGNELVYSTIAARPFLRETWLNALAVGGGLPRQLPLGPAHSISYGPGAASVLPRHRLADGTLTTQPEFSHWYGDVGWNLENHGADPDIEVDNAPQDYAAGVDRQLERGIQTASELLQQRPPSRPKFGERRRLRPAPLPKRA